MKKSAQRILLILLLLTPLFSREQPLTLTFSSTPNSVCNGYGCRYDGPSILINEVMMMPRLFDSSIMGCPSSFDTTRQCEGEWIELYNPDNCHFVDISCYFLGNAAPDRNALNQFGTYAAGFILPEGTIVPPRGFVIVRGRKAPPVPDHLLVENGGSTVEIVVDDPQRVCIQGSRLWFPNAGGWFAFYDRNGVPQDAITWGTEEQGLNFDACNPGHIGACGYTGQLVNYSQIPFDRKNKVSARGPEEGKTFRRVPDGGSWDFDQPADPTYGICNTACILPYIPTCNGSAAVSVSGGLPPYSIVWDDGNGQTTDTAAGLCSGNYCAAVTDADNTTVSGCVAVNNIHPEVTALSQDEAYCEGAEIKLSAEASQGTAPYIYYWTGPGFQSNEQNPVILNACVEYSGIYNVTVRDTHECIKSAHTFVNVKAVPVLSIESTYPWCTGGGIRMFLSDINELTNIQWTGPPGFILEGDSLHIPNAADKNSGLYTVSAEALNGCETSPALINVIVSDIPIVDLGGNQSLCEKKITLDVQNLSSRYEWSTGETTQKITINKPGKYWVVVNHNGCIETDTVIVTSIKPELSIIQQGDLCKNHLAVLYAATDAEDILWNTGAVTDSIIIREQGIYSVAAFNCACETKKLIEIQCGCLLIFPNAFFSPVNTFWTEFYHLYIYDRWGNIIFETKDIKKPWDGAYKGRLSPGGAYVYKVYYICRGDNVFKEQHGAIMLIR